MRKREKVIISFALIGIFISLSYLVVIPLSRIKTNQPQSDINVSDEFEPAELPQVIDLDLPEQPTTELPPIVEIEDTDPTIETSDPVEIDQPQTLPDNVGSNTNVIEENIVAEVPVKEEITPTEELPQENTASSQETMDSFTQLFESATQEANGEVASQSVNIETKYNRDLLLTLLVGVSSFFGILLTYVWWKEIKA